MSETRYNTVTETEYRTVTKTQYREVPKIVYETAYQDEEQIVYRTEYETRTRNVPKRRAIEKEHSHDSGDGVESDERHEIPAVHGNHLTQPADYAMTSDSSDDTHVYTVTEYVKEEYQVARKVPERVVKQVPIQLAKTVYEQVAVDVEVLEPYEVEK